MMRYLLLLVVNAILFLGCADNTSSSNNTTDADTQQADTTIPADDMVNNAAYASALSTIRKNFARINNINHWDKIDSAELWVSLEGGQAKYYYKDEVLEKVVARTYGEMGESIEEYYFLNNTLSFVYEKQYRYNRPVYYDSNVMKQMDDTEVFDFSKSEIVERRYYFADNHLFHHVDSEDCGAPFAPEYLTSLEQNMFAMVDTLMAKRKH